MALPILSEHLVRMVFLYTVPFDKFATVLHIHLLLHKLRYTLLFYRYMAFIFSYGVHPRIVVVHNSLFDKYTSLSDSLLY